MPLLCLRARALSRTFPDHARQYGPALPARPLLAALLALAGAPAARAAPVSLEAISVTGARETIALADALQDITVIDRATIEAHAGASLESLLAQQAGIQVAASGGIGTVSSVFVRGANADSTLLLIDGMRYGSASAGTPIFYNLPLEQIDHIEIVRGPMSAVYGSDAAGGVIQIFTRRGREGMQADASATLGSEKSGALSAGVRGAAGNLDYALGLASQRTDGYPNTNAHAAFGIYNPNDDRFVQNSASANLGYALVPGWSVRLQGLDARASIGFADGFDPTQPGFTARSVLGTASGGFTVQGQLAPEWSTRLRYSAARDSYDTDRAVNAYDLGRFTTSQQLALWQNDVTTALGTVLIAAEQLRQEVASSTTVFDTDRRTVNGLQLGWNGRAGASSWQANVRSDGNSQFGRQNTGALAYGFDLSPQWRLGASAGTSFVMPSFNDLYYPGYSNPDLRAQHGRSAELSLRWQTRSDHLQVALYQNRFRDLIALDANYLPVNIGQSRIRGLSAQYGVQLGSLDVEAVLDAMDPRDLVAGTRLPHRARNALSLKADWRVAPRWTAGALLRASGPRYDDAANTQVLGGYGELGLHGDWQFARQWQLSLRIDNLADHHWEPAYGYDAPPRLCFLTLRYAAR